MQYIKFVFQNNILYIAYIFKYRSHENESAYRYCPFAILWESGGRDH